MRLMATRLLMVFACLLVVAACTSTAKPRPVTAAPEKKFAKKPALPSLDDYSEGSSISDVHWKWVSTLQPHENSHNSPHSDNYLLELKTDGWFNVEAPCFKGDGMYEISKDRIAFALLHSYPARKCLPKASLAFFLKALEGSSSYREDSDRLSLYDKRTKTTLFFLRQGD